jgi:hypothetical protein
MQVILKPECARVRQLIKKHGAVWTVLEIAHVQCFDDMSVLAESPDGSHSRWIKLDNLAFTQ